MTVVASTVALLLPSWSQGFVAGVIASSGFWVVGVVVVLETGSASLLAGASGEQLTASELRRLQRHGWHLVNHLVLKGRGDVDHVAVGPGGLLVVETKWRSDAWDLSVLDDPIIVEATAQASRNANITALWLRRSLGRVEPHVAIVAWGPQLSWDVDNPIRTSEGVTIVPGPFCREWLDTLPTDGLDETRVSDAWKMIDEQVRQRDRADIQRDGPPPQRIDRVLFAWLAKVAVGYAAFSTALLAARVFPTMGAVIGIVATFAVGMATRRAHALRPYVNAWFVGIMIFSATAIGAAIAIGITQ